METLSDEFPLTKDAFGNDFVWGVSASAFQTEGAVLEEGKGLSSWDEFLLRKKTPHYQGSKTATDFFHRYPQDLSLMRSLGISNFRFSLAWSRIFPNGGGSINQKGIDFYNRLIDTCIKKNITPWVTLYHWDLPSALEHKGGWTNRDIIHWFTEYVQCCSRHFGDRVVKWMVLNEPMVFTGAGYFLGKHAPGKKGINNFLSAAHHAVLCQAIGYRVMKEERPLSETGSTFSCSFITPFSQSVKDVAAALRIDALLNRMFLEPALGMGYPFADIPFLRMIEKYFRADDEKLMDVNFDFVGIQNYTREVVAYAFHVPFLHARLVPANTRKVYHTSMNWEVYPTAIYEMVRKYSSYKQVKRIIITENGAAFHDELNDGKIHDEERIRFLQHYLSQVLRAKKEGLQVDGYFIWTFTDNFEWTEGFRQRFGLVYVDFKSQERIVKDSGKWFKGFLSGEFGLSIH